MLEFGETHKGGEGEKEKKLASPRPRAQRGKSLTSPYFLYESLPAPKEERGREESFKFPCLFLEPTDYRRRDEANDYADLVDPAMAGRHPGRGKKRP